MHTSSLMFPPFYGISHISLKMQTCWFCYTNSIQNNLPMNCELSNVFYWSKNSLAWKSSLCEKYSSVKLTKMEFIDCKHISGSSPQHSLHWTLHMTDRTRSYLLVWWARASPTCDQLIVVGGALTQTLSIALFCMTVKRSLWQLVPSL